MAIPSTELLSPIAPFHAPAALAPPLRRPPGWSSIVASEILGSVFPTTYGGKGHNIPEALIRMERLGEQIEDAGLSFSAVTTIASTGTAVCDFGTAEQRANLLPRICRGQLIGAHAITEAESGSDAIHMATTAVRDGDHLVIDGTKSFVTNAGVADVYVVYVRTATTPNPLGLTAVMVPAGTPGLHVTGITETAGLTTSPVGELRLDSCRVPATSVIGGVGRGFLVLDHVMKREILYSFSVNVGEMKRRLDEVVGWATRRHQYGKAISGYQAVAHRIVEMRIQLETSRAMLRAAGDALHRGEPATAEIAMAKIVASEANLASAIAATRVFGGRGFLREHGIERHVRDALGGGIYSGTNDIQYNRIAAEMGLR